MTIIHPDLAALILRLGFGFFMAFGHGLGKTMKLFSGAEIHFPSVLGMPEVLSLALAAFAEFFCALMVMIGYKTRLFALPVIITMIVAAFHMHAGDPLYMKGADGGSKEPALLFLFAFVTIYLLGSGRYSVDDRIDSAI